MAFKLGELLIQQKLITSSQLEEALQFQVIFGGRLGTNLLEMGCLKEEDIARVLSNKLGVPYFESSEQLASIPEELIRLIPRELAEKYRVIPVKLENHKLTLVMADPSNLNVIDELAFRTGCIIQPMVAPELRVSSALERYYNIQRSARSVQFVHVHHEQERTKQGISPPPLPPFPTAETVNKPQTEFSSVKPRQQPPAATQVTLLEDLEEAELFEEVLPLVDPTPCTLESIALQLTASSDREDIADGIAEYIGQEFPRGALFMIRGGNAFGWKAMMDGEEIARFDEFQIPLDEPSVLKTVAETGSNFLGPIPRTPFNSMMLQEFGGRMPETALLLPLFMMGRVVGILYIDGDSHEIRARIGDLQRLIAKAIMAFEILILKKKILTL